MGPASGATGAAAADDKGGVKGGAKPAAKKASSTASGGTSAVSASKIDAVTGPLEALPLDTIDLCARALFNEGHVDACSRLRSMVMSNMHVFAGSTSGSEATVVAADMQLMAAVHQAVLGHGGVRGGSTSAAGDANSSLQSLAQCLLQVAPLLCANHRGDLVEEAALALWGRCQAADTPKMYHEGPNAAFLLRVVAQSLMTCKHSDVLAIAKLVELAAVAQLRTSASPSKDPEVTGDDEDASPTLEIADIEQTLKLLKAGTHRLHHRLRGYNWTQLVKAGHGHAGVLEGETFDHDQQPWKLGDSAWARALRDAGTVLQFLLCRFRAKLAFQRSLLEHDAEHQRTCRLMEERKQRTAILGRVTLKEERAIAAASAVNPAAGEMAKGLDVNDAYESVLLKVGGPYLSNKCLRAVAIVAAVAESRLPANEGSASARLRKLEEASSLVRDTASDDSGFSRNVTWCLLALAASRRTAAFSPESMHQSSRADLSPGELKVLCRCREAIFENFVKRGPTDEKIWNRNPAAWDTLRDDAVNSASTSTIRLLSHAFAAISILPSAERLSADGTPRSDATSDPFVPEENFLDDEDDGPDPRRLSRQQSEMRALRAINVFLFALDLGAAAQDDTAITGAVRGIANELLPLARIRPVSPLLLRPVSHVLHSFGTLQPRRWTNPTLQLAAVRTFQVAMDLAKQLPNGGTRKAFVDVLSATFCQVYQLVRLNPSEQQQLNIARALSEMKFVKSALKPIKIEGFASQATDASPAAVAPTAKGPAAKPSGGKTSSSAASASGQGDGAPKAPQPYQSPFIVGSLSDADVMPIEFLQLVEQLFLSPLSLCPLPADAALTNALPDAYMQLASVMHNPAATANSLVTKIAELKGSVLMSKCATLAVAWLCQRKHFDAAQALINDTVAEIKSRKQQLTAIETDYLAALNAAMPATTAHSDAGSGAHGQTSPTERARVVLTRRIALLRRRVALRKVRTLRVQHDEPFHALMHLTQSCISFRELVKSQQRHLLRPSTASKPSAASDQGRKGGPPAATAGKGLTPVPPAAKKAGVENAAGLGDKPLAGDCGQVQPESPETIKQRATAIDAAVRSFVIFSRQHCWQHAAAAMLQCISVVRTSFGECLPVLVDISASSSAVGAGTGKSESGMSSIRPSSTASSTTPTGRTTSIQPATDGSATRSAIENFSKVEQYMKVTATEIVRMISMFTHGRWASPIDEFDAMQPPGVKVGRDFDVEGGIFGRTTSLSLLLSRTGLAVSRNQRARMAAFGRRIQKVFERERSQFAMQEAEARLSLEASLLQELRTMACNELGLDPAGEPSDGDHTEGGSITQRSSRAVTRQQKRKTANLASPEKDAASPLNRRPPSCDLSPQCLGPFTNVDEMFRCFHYATQAMQYGRLKQSCVQICLDMNAVTDNRFATRLLPYVANLQYATNQPFQRTLEQLATVSRDEPRAQRLVAVAQRSWAVYRGSEQFVTKVLPRLGNSIMPNQPRLILPGKAQQMLATSINTDDATSVATGAGGGVAASGYRDVVGLYNAAVDYLRQKRSRQRLMALLVELGHIHLLHRNKVEAQVAWESAVDAAFGRPKTLRDWRTMLPEFIADPSKLGTWKALWAVVALSKLAMFTFVNDQTKAHESCVLAAELLRCTLSGSSLTFPQRPFDALECELTELPGGLRFDNMDSDLPSQLIQGLGFVGQSLLVAGLPVQTAVVATFLEFAARTAARSNDWLAFSRSLKATAAGQLGNFRVAIRVLNDLVKGAKLIDKSFAHLGVALDADAGQNKGANLTGASNTGKSAAAAAGGAAAAGKPDNKKLDKRPDDNSGGATQSEGGASSLDGFVNAKPLTDEANCSAIDALIAHCAAASTSSFSLPDAIVAEYGEVVAAHAALALASTFLSLLESDPALVWQSSASLTPPEEAPGAKKGASKAQGDASGAPSVPGGATISAMIQLVERITSLTLGSAVGRQPSLLAAAIRGRLAILRGQSAAASAELQVHWSALGQSEPAPTTSTASMFTTPSFLRCASARDCFRFGCTLAQSLTQERRFESALAVVEELAQLALSTNDRPCERDAHLLAATIQFQLGETDEAAKRLAAAVRLSTELDWKSFDERGVLAQVQSAAVDAWSWRSRTCRTATLRLDSVGTDGHASSHDAIAHDAIPAPTTLGCTPEDHAASIAIIARWRSAVDASVQLSRYAGANFEVLDTKASHQAAGERFNPYLPLLAAASASLSEFALERGDRQTASQAAKICLAAATQSHVLSDKTVQFTCTARVVLARAMRPAASLPLPGTTVDDIAELCRSALSDTVLRGIHDVQVLRAAGLELCLAVLFRSPQQESAPANSPSHRPTHGGATDAVAAKPPPAVPSDGGVPAALFYLRLAARATVLKGRAVNNFCPQGELTPAPAFPADIGDVASHLAGRPWEVLDEEARRGSLCQWILAAEAAQASMMAGPADGKQAAAKATTDKSPSSPSARPSVTLPLTVAVFSQLQSEHRSSALLSGQVAPCNVHEAALAKLRHFLQLKGGPCVSGDLHKVLGVAAAGGTSTDSPFLLDRAPIWSATDHQGLPPLRPWTVFVAHYRNLPALPTASGAGGDAPEVASEAAPTSLLVFGWCASGGGIAEDTVAAAVGKSAKSGKAAAQASEAASELTSIPPVAAVLSVPSAKVSIVHHFARRALLLLAQSAASVDPIFEDGADPSGGAKGGKTAGKQQATAPAAPGAKAGGAGRGGAPASAEGVRPNSLPTSPTPSGPTSEDLFQEAKSQLLVEFVELISLATRATTRDTSLPAHTSRRAASPGQPDLSRFYPPFPLGPHHVQFLADLSGPDGGATAAADKDLVEWIAGMAEIVPTAPPPAPR